MAPKIVYAQAYIATLTFPDTLSGLEHLVGDNPRLAGDPIDSLLSLPRDESWTAPQWADAGDVVLFHYAASARPRPRKLRKLARDSGVLSAGLENFLDYADGRAQQFAGHIIALGILDGPAVYLGTKDDRHWRTRRYAPIRKIWRLRDTIAISEHTDILPLPHATITPLTATQFSSFKKYLTSLGPLSRDLRNIEAGRDSLVGITAKNWQEISCAPEQQFRHETELRGALCDHFLAMVADEGSAIHHEVRCAPSESTNAPRADYVFQLNGQWIPVEVKLNVEASEDLLGQVSRYTAVEAFCANISTVLPSSSSAALVIDKAGLYIVRGRRFVNGGPGKPWISRQDLGRATRTDMRKRLIEAIGGFLTRKA